MPFYNNTPELELRAREHVLSESDDAFECPYYDHMEMTTFAADAIVNQCHEKAAALGNDYVLLADLFNQYLYDTYHVSAEDLSFLSTLVFSASIGDLSTE